MLTQNTKGEIFGAAEVHGKAPIGLLEAAGFHQGFGCLQTPAATKSNCRRLVQTPNSLMCVTNVHTNSAFAGTN